MMKIFRHAGLAGIALSVLAACGTTSDPRHAESRSVAAPQGLAQNVAQPLLQVGETWSFQRVDLWRNEVVERYEQELRIKEGDRWTVQWRITDTQDARRRGSVTGEYLDARTLAFADTRMKGRHVPLNFPLQVGKQWSFQYEIVPEHHRNVVIDQTAKVVGWEEVTVPAGRFRTLKVVHEGRYRATDSGYTWNGSIRETYWYSPEARRVVRMEYRDTKGDGTPYDQWRDELVSMRLAAAPAAPPPPQGRLR